MKLWKDKHKFPHVADRLGWSFLGEYPLDKKFLLFNLVPYLKEWNHIQLINGNPLFRYHH